MLATAIDSKVVATARDDVYATERFKGVSNERMSNWFPAATGRPDFCEASDDLKAIVTFKELNLLDAWPIKDPFDVIF